MTLNASLRAGTALLFAFALVHKLRSFAAFQGTLAGYVRGLPIRPLATTLLAVAVIAMEFLVVIACALPDAALQGAALAVSLLLSYAAAMGANIARGNALPDCGCTWGAVRQPVSVSLVLRNAILAAVAAAIALPVNDRAVQAVDLASIVCATLAFACLYGCANHLLALAQPAHGRAR